MAVFDLTDKAVEYKEKRVRANAVVAGDTIFVDDMTCAVVLSVAKTPFRVAEGDEETSAVLREIKEQGEDDKISPNFDETVIITIAHAMFDDDGATRIVKEDRYYAEWDYVITYV